KVEARMARLKDLDEKLGHNGFFVVMMVRLAHFLPFGISNYLFGLTNVAAGDVALGTLLGGVPGVVIYVTLGAHRRFLADWRYVSALAVLNILLLTPVVLRYL